MKQLKKFALRQSLRKNSSRFANGYTSSFSKSPYSPRQGLCQIKSPWTSPLAPQNHWELSRSPGARRSEEKSKLSASITVVKNANPQGNFSPSALFENTHPSLPQVFFPCPGKSGSKPRSGRERDSFPCPA